jgi:hypothetical protein
VAKLGQQGVAHGGQALAARHSQLGGVWPPRVTTC